MITAVTKLILTSRPHLSPWDFLFHFVLFCFQVSTNCFLPFAGSNVLTPFLYISKTATSDLNGSEQAFLIEFHYNF